MVGQYSSIWHKTRVVLLLWAVTCGVTAASAQQTTSVHLGAVPEVGIVVKVDGVAYTTPQQFVWPATSQHSICVDSPQYGAAKMTQLTVGTIVTNLGAPLNSTATCSQVTADPHLSSITIQVTVLYKVTVSYYSCPGYQDPSNPCPDSATPGTVFVDGQKFTMDAVLYLPAGSHQLQAFPSPALTDTGLPKWIFVGWYSTPTFDGPAFINSFLVRGPGQGIYPHFVPARIVNLVTSPTGLQLLADRNPVSTPYKAVWGWGTTHNLNAVDSQLDNHGKLFIFDSWDDGGAETHAYTVPNGMAPLTVTANFVPGERVTFLTSPPGVGLKLTSVDGQTYFYQGYNFNWAVNSTHTATAPATQVGSDGRTYNFQGWSTGATNPVISVTVPSTLGGLGLRLTANYQVQSGVTVTSTTPGLVIQADGQSCALPCNLARSIGSAVKLSAPASAPISNDSRYDFQGWNDGGGTDRTVTVGSDPVTLTLSYSLRNRLAVTAAPPEGLTVQLDPATADGFYDAQTQVQVTANVKAGFRFRNWEGDVSGTSRQVSLAMSSPHFLRAVLDRVPAVAEGGVKNAAGDTPANAVAAGSIIAIYGFNLAEDLAVGPDSPLAQTLGGVTVSIGARILPLFFVSPQQINVQLPSDLQPGGNTLSVQLAGQAAISAGFQVARNAPGLFSNTVNGQPYAAALHENGDPVTTDNPARHGETVTLLGDGLGPFVQNPPDGFAVPDSTSYALADPVKVLSGDTSLDPVWAGAAAGRVGVTAVRLQITDDLPRGATVELKVRVNDQDSNTVLLPLD